MIANINLNINFDLDLGDIKSEEITQKIIEEIKEKVLKCELVDKSGFIEDIHIGKPDLTFFDNDGIELEWTINQDSCQETYYKPACKYGYCDCICDPMYIKNTYPEWYKKLGCPTTCQDCVDGNQYDDEDK